MCYRFSMNAKVTTLAARYHRKSDVLAGVPSVVEEQQDVNAFTFPLCPIITDAPQIQAYQWGLIPSWTKTEEDANKLRKMTLNARNDTIFSKPSYRESILKRRCLIPVSGYYEWRHEDDAKIAYYLFVKDEPLFSIAGLYDEWLDRGTGEVVKTFSMITTEANSLAAYVHNTQQRMPAIIRQQDEDRWLSRSIDKSQIAALLQPISAHLMEAHIVNRLG